MHGEILPMIRMFLFGLMVLGLAACETTKGAGRDLQKAGQTISNTARNVQNSI
ncbi:entericidin A/B family lipoprotein [Tritonibacter sp. SIMBA_163]|uniref:entericidin A/B family lipoprotein n=1 Tax=Tritonibacter sp. SIMBA_163 TaxID=3080868 RepID=UPI00397F9152